MTRLRPITNSFVFGQVDENMHGRTDLEVYAKAGKVIEEMTVLPQGGVRRRDGSVFVKEVRSSAEAARLIPFEQDDENSYILELNNLFMRFYKSNARLGAPYQIAIPWTAAQLFDVRYAKDQCCMFLVHGSHMIRHLEWTSDTSWALTKFDPTDGPYLDANAGAITLTMSANTGSITVTASSALFAATDTTGSGGTGDYDRLISHTHSSVTSWLKITAFTSTTVVTATVAGVNLGGTSGVATWSLGAWSTTTGFPRAVGFFEQRLIFMSTTNQPQNIWASKTGEANYSDFTPGVTADDPFSYTIAAREMNRIQWMGTLSTDLFFGTSKAEYLGSAATPPVSPTNFSAIARSWEGSGSVDTIQAKNSIVFAQRDIRRLFELRFDGSLRAYMSEELSWHARNIFAGGIVEMAYQNSPNGIIWIVRTDGKLVAYTYDRSRGVFAPTLCNINGTVESVAVIPAADGSADELWIVVNRTIGAATKRYVEYLSPGRNTDSSILYSGGSTTTITGLSHLEGLLVKVKGDGAEAASKTVASGSITLDSAVTAAEVGIGYTFRLHTLSPDLVMSDGSGLGRRQRAHNAVIRLKSSLGGNLFGDPLEYRTEDTPLDEAPAVFTGDKEIGPDVAWSDDGSMELSGDEPYDFEVSAIVTYVDATV